MRPPVPDWFYLLIIVGGLPLMRMFIRDGVGRLIRIRRRERGEFVGYIDRPWLAKREDK